MRISISPRWLDELARRVGAAGELFPEISKDNFDAQYSYQGVNFDTREGIGSCPNNANIRYMGMSVIMPIADFLGLAQPFMGKREDSLEFIQQAIENKTAFGPPMLYVELDPSGEALLTEALNTVKVVGHEGRHRCVAFRRLGLQDVPVHIVPKFTRSRHLKNAVDDLLDCEWTSEDGSKQVKPRVTKYFLG